MKKPLLAAMAALTILAGQGAAAQTQAPKPPAPGTPAYCYEKWDEMVARNDTGGQDRDDFIRQCLTRRRGGGDFFPAGGDLALLAYFGWIAAAILIGFSNEHQRPISP